MSTRAVGAIRVLFLAMGMMGAIEAGLPRRGNGSAVAGRAHGGGRGFSSDQASFSTFSLSSENEYFTAGTTRPKLRRQFSRRLLRGAEQPLRDGDDSEYDDNLDLADGDEGQEGGSGELAPPEGLKPLCEKPRASADNYVDQKPPPTILRILTKKQKNMLRKGVPLESGKTSGWFVYTIAGKGMGGYRDGYTRPELFSYIPRRYGEIQESFSEDSSDERLRIDAPDEAEMRIFDRFVENSGKKKDQVKGPFPYALRELAKDSASLRNPFFDKIKDFGSSPRIGDMSAGVMKTKRVFKGAYTLAPARVHVDRDGRTFFSDANQAVRVISPNGFFVRTVAGGSGLANVNDDANAGWLENSLEGDGQGSGFQDLEAREEDLFKFSRNLHRSVYPRRVRPNEIIDIMTPRQKKEALKLQELQKRVENERKARKQELESIHAADGRSSNPRVKFQSNMGLRIGLDGSVWVADAGSHRIRKIHERLKNKNCETWVTTIAGGLPGFRDGMAPKARDRVIDRLTQRANSGNNNIHDEAETISSVKHDPNLNSPFGMCFDSKGNCYIADTGNNAIRKLTAEGQLSTLIGDPNEPTSASVGEDAEGRTRGENARVPVPNYLNHRNPAEMELQDFGADCRYRNGVRENARLYLPKAVACAKDGTIYIADSGNHCIRKLHLNGTVSTLAGSRPEKLYRNNPYQFLKGLSGFADGCGTNALFRNPVDIALTENENLIVADRDNGVIRKITPSGVVTTLAGRVLKHGRKDGLVGYALFNHPSGVAIDHRDGSIVVADTYNDRICRVTFGDPQAYVDEDEIERIQLTAAARSTKTFKQREKIELDKADQAIEEMSPDKNTMSASYEDPQELDRSDTASTTRSSELIHCDELFEDPPRKSQRMVADLERQHRLMDADYFRSLKRNLER